MTEDELLRWIDDSDHRYHLNAYRFVLSALHFTQQELGGRRHISGPELLVGIKDYAWEEFGSLAMTVLEDWGIHTTRDIGNIVFNMVGLGQIKKTEEDAIEDFDEVFDLAEAFRAEEHKTAH